MPVPVPPPPDASHVPSHLPWHSTPPCAVHDPVQLPVHEPSHDTDALPLALHSPLHATTSLPPVHFGGLALMSHFTPPEHFAWQSSFASTDASHFGGCAATVMLPLPFAVPIAFTASEHHAFIFWFLS